VNSHRPIKDEVKEQLPWLFENLSFRIVEDAYEPDSFGNSFVTLESFSLRIRFVRDRSEVSAEVASRTDPGIWWNLEDVCELVSGKTIGAPFDLSTAGGLLKAYFPVLSVALGEKYSESKRELQLRAEKRKQETIKRLSGPKG
jgi:hypothetical protein